MSNDSIVRSEMNIERFMFCVTSKYTKKSHRVERSVVDEEGNVAVHAVTVGKLNDSEVGVLRIFDLKILYALLKLWQDAGRPLSTDVCFSVHELATLLGLSWSGKTSTLVQNSLKRLRFVPIEWENSYYTKSIDTTEKLISGFTILSDLTTHQRSAGRGAPTSKCSFKFEARLTRNLLENYSKPLRLDEMLKLESEIALMLYTRLDLFLAKASSMEKTLTKLINDLGLDIAAYPTPSKRKKLFERAVDELRGKELGHGIISDIDIVPTTDRSDHKLVVKKGPSLSRIEAPHRTTSAVSEAPSHSESAESSVVRMLTKRGVSVIVARRLARDFPADQIEKQVAHFDWREKNRPGSTKSGGGWLKNAIEQNYSPPEELLVSTRPRVNVQSSQQSADDFNLEIQSMRTRGEVPELWAQCLGHLREVVSPVGFGALQQVYVSAVANRSVTLAAQDSLTLSLCREDHRSAVDMAVKRVFGDVTIKFQLDTPV